jgi:hypothetical protein
MINPSTLNGAAQGTVTDIGTPFAPLLSQLSGVGSVGQTKVSPVHGVEPDAAHKVTVRVPVITSGPELTSQLSVIFLLPGLA